MDLTRAKFDELTSDLVEKTAEPVQRALSDAGTSSVRSWPGTSGRWFYTYSGCTG